MNFNIYNTKPFFEERKKYQIRQIDNSRKEISWIEQEIGWQTLNKNMNIFMLSPPEEELSQFEIEMFLQQEKIKNEIYEYIRELKLKSSELDSELLKEKAKKELLETNIKYNMEKLSNKIKKQAKEIHKIKAMLIRRWLREAE